MENLLAQNMFRNSFEEEHETRGFMLGSVCMCACVRAYVSMREREREREYKVNALRQVTQSAMTK